MKRLLLVDACNVLHRLPGLPVGLDTGIDAAVQALLAHLRPLHDLEQWEVHLVVDGRGPRLEQQFHDPGRTLSILYAPASQSADTVIESWLLRIPADWEIRVASEDRAIAHSAIARGAEPVSAKQLGDWLQRAHDRFSAQQTARRKIPLTPFNNPLEGLP